MFQIAQSFSAPSEEDGISAVSLPLLSLSSETLMMLLAQSRWTNLFGSHHQAAPLDSSNDNVEGLSAAKLNINSSTTISAKQLI